MFDALIRVIWTVERTDAEFAAVGFKRLRLHKTVVIRDSPGRLIGAGNDVVDDA